ncbi:recombinase family protein [Allobacillus sp. GCM10007491]|uniref:Recombinase family protein n=1 Tax=Allobacillus saliphilus TaxID=2912308 RepID=A0A941HTN9_9BACI|nr:recombinase family protein [Allobacillus saliphilus]MBR7554020.1 recombinase family protein [Allobacillus saliphilus]
MIIGYLRKANINIDYKKQRALLQQENCIEIVVEGEQLNDEEHQLDQLIHELKEGDKLVVPQLATLADSIRSLAQLLEKIHQKGAFIQTIDEKIDTSETTKYELLDLVSGLANFQREKISEKTRKGLHEAKSRGASTGRPRKPDANVKQALSLYDSKKFSLQEIKEQTGISKSTLYRYLDERN